MSYKITGIVYEIGRTEQRSERFQSRDLVIEKTETAGDKTFTEHIKFQATNDRCDLLDNIRVGQEVTVSFNLRGRKWENREGKVQYFTNLDIWKVEHANGTTAGTQQSSGSSSMQDDEGGDSLPF